jgi:1,4-dihydroxy-2-naphthoate octaprenyltransferase
MSQPVAGLPYSGESLRRAVIHLRLAFSLVLTPLFLWGIYLALPRQLAWPQVLLAYLIIHIPLYGGMNAFNSFYDQDEGPIGALLDPPPVDYAVLYIALLCKGVALIGGLLLDARFGLLIGAGIVLSALYSHPLARWKERPLLAALCIFVGQGVLGVLWGWTAATASGAGAAAALWPPGTLNLVAVLSAALWTLGFYPLTGVYQIENDRGNNIHTLAVALGVGGSFLFAACVASLGGLGVWIVLFERGAYLAMAISGIYLIGASIYTWRWYRRFSELTTRENQRMLMRLAYANGALFSLLFLALILIGG